MMSPGKTMPWTNPNRSIHQPRRRTRRRASTVARSRAQASSCGVGSRPDSIPGKDARKVWVPPAIRRLIMVMSPKPNSIANNG